MAHQFNVANKEKLDDPQRRQLLPPTEILIRSGLVAGAVMADIGCGTGYFTLPAAELVGTQGNVYGLDVSEVMIAAAKAKAEELSLSNITFLQINGESFPLPNKAVDYVLVSMVVHELHDLETFFREIDRILREDGKLVIIEWTPHDDVIMGPPPTERISRSALKRVLEKSGFTVTIEQVLNFEMYELTIARRKLYSHYIDGAVSSEK
jgi:ubiquinone/menaquinone biosynthesis C-methylase UbiE